MTQKELLKNTITFLVDKLPLVYPDLNFENHCYRRIAYDELMQCKWDTKVKKPFVDNINITNLSIIILTLTSFVESKQYLLRCNEKSLKYRSNERNNKKS